MNGMRHQRCPWRSLVTVLLWVGLLRPFPLCAETLRVSVLDGLSEINLSAADGFMLDGGLMAHTARVSVHPTGLAIGQAPPLPSSHIQAVLKNRGGFFEIKSHRSGGNRFAGALHIQKEGNTLRVINEIPVEQYLQGVVPAEMPAHWPIEALKAQAVISRTYALYQKQERHGTAYDLVSSTRDQVYQGVSAIDPRASSAIAQTKDQVLTDQGRLALTFFHSTSAGPTENAADHWKTDHKNAATRALPYLSGVSCPFDQDSPYYRWQRVIPRQEIERKLREDGYPVGTLSDMLPVQWSRAGRLLEVRVVHTEGTVTLHADDFRRVIGYNKLPSTKFQVDDVGETVQISGMGYGHGVGLCQWGARTLAEAGWRYEDILRYYYPGTVLKSRTSP